MGHNVDLQNLLGLPEYVRCPRCQEMTKSYFDEYDIDCGNPAAKPIGKQGSLCMHTMTLTTQCGHCDFADIEFQIRISFEDKNAKKGSY